MDLDATIDILYFWLFLSDFWLGYVFPRTKRNTLRYFVMRNIEHDINENGWNEKNRSETEKKFEKQKKIGEYHISE